MSSAAAVCVVGRERGVGEEMLLAGIEEELGVVGRGGERARSLEVLVEELVALLAVDLHGHAGRPRLSELGEGEARGHEQRAAAPGRACASCCAAITPKEMPA